MKYLTTAILFLFFVAIFAFSGVGNTDNVAGVQASHEQDCLFLMEPKDHVTIRCPGWTDTIINLLTYEAVQLGRQIDGASTATVTATSTSTPITPTATATNTPIPPTATATATNTPVTPTPTKVVTPSPTPTKVVTPTPTKTPTLPVDQQAGCLDSFEQEFLRLINQHRAANGLNALVASKTISIASFRHSLDMYQRQYFAHDTLLPLPEGQSGPRFSDRMRDAGYTFNTAKGENIAAGQVTAQRVFDAWRNSEGHNRNMLNPNYRAIGIGRYYIYDLSSRYRAYWTTDFGGVVDAPAPNC